MLFTKPKRAVGIDIGTHSAKVVQMSRAGGRLRVDTAGYALVDRNLANSDPVAAQASSAREALRGVLVSQSLLVGALPGQTVVIRYPRLPEMAEDRIGAALEKEAGQHIPYDLAEVFLDWTLLDTVPEGKERLLKVLLVAAKHDVIESRMQVATSAELEYSILGVDSLALADAAEACDFLRVGETVALVNLGLSTVSIHFVKDGVSNFIRDVNWGARELIQAISRARRIDYDQAEKLLCTLEPVAEEAATATIVGGETAPAETAAPRPPVSGASLLDPFEEELDAAAPHGPQPGPEAGEKDLAQILATPLARLVAELRRSFDYYEHELYETGVDRLILSGGIAHIPVLFDTLNEELGLKSIEVANPVESALVLSHERDVAALRERPGQFMVALGLAARGVAEL